MKISCERKLTKFLPAAKPAGLWTLGVVVVVVVLVEKVLKVMLSKPLDYVRGF